MKKFNAQYCSNSVNHYASYAKREFSYTYSVSYDSDNYAYYDSRESIERCIGHYSIESLLEM